MTVKSAGSTPVHTVQVRELVEFVLRSGDLGADRDFVGSDRALKGIRGHQKLLRSRPPGYQTEIPVEYTVEAGEFTLLVRGRIDGLLATDQEVLLEEIKTIQGAWNGQADPLHWAQAKFYAFIHAHEHGLKGITVQLAYLDLETGKVTEFRQAFAFAELSEFVASTVAVYVEWLRERHRWCQTRDESIRAVAFPFPAYRPGQRELAVAAYRVLANGGRLFVSAPNRRRQNHFSGVPGPQTIGRRQAGAHLLPDGTHGWTNHRREGSDRPAIWRLKASVSYPHGQGKDPACPGAEQLQSGSNRMKTTAKEALARRQPCEIAADKP